MVRVRYQTLRLLIFCGAQPHPSARERKWNARKRKKERIQGGGGEGELTAPSSEALRSRPGLLARSRAAAARGRLCICMDEEGAQRGPVVHYAKCDSLLIGMAAACAPLSLSLSSFPACCGTSLRPPGSLSSSFYFLPLTHLLK